MQCRVKICGLTSLEDARFCAGAGADYLGFIQHPPSPRYIAPDQVRQIKAWIYGPKTVGVFVNIDAETVNHSCTIANFDQVQLHGDESPAYCRRMTLPVIKAFSVKPSTSARSLARILTAYQDCVELFLLDTWHPELAGGTGKSFDWNVAKTLAVDFPIMLAGGLNPGNIKQAIQSASPWGVDISSGLEYTTGEKDFDLVVNLFESIAKVSSDL